MQQVQGLSCCHSAVLLDFRLLCWSGGMLGGRGAMGCADGEICCGKDCWMVCALGGTDASEAPTARLTAVGVDVVVRAAEGQGMGSLSISRSLEEEQGKEQGVPTSRSRTRSTRSGRLATSNRG